MQNTEKSPLVINAKGKKVGIVVSRFNESITRRLLESAKVGLAECGVAEKNIQVIYVAGAVEIPYALLKLAKSKNYNCLVAIGCIIRGETPHFDYVAKTVQEGTLKVCLDNAIPIGFGVLTTNNLKQAQARYHVGKEAVYAALELAQL